MKVTNNLPPPQIFASNFKASRATDLRSAATAMLISVRAFLAAGGERVTVAPYQNRTSAAEGTRGTKENIGLNFSLVFPPAGREMRRTYQLKQNRELDNPSALPLEAHLQQKNVFLIIYNTP